MLHKKDGKNLTKCYVRRIYNKSGPDIWNKTAVQSWIGSVFLHLFYLSGKPEAPSLRAIKGSQ
jgi:hypothetical protein